MLAKDICANTLHSTKAMGKVLVCPIDNNVEHLLNVHLPVLKKTC